MVNTVKSFPSMTVDLPITMLSVVILSHGDERGNLRGIDNSLCSVQQLLNSLNKKELAGIPKVY